MTATVRTLPNGHRVVTCDRCKTQTTTPFREVALKWARTHTCPRPGRRAAA